MSYLTPTPVLSAQEAARSHQQQTAHLPGKIPKQRLRFKDPHAHKTKCCIM